MPDPVQKYIEANDNASDYADKLIKDLEQQALEDIDDLYRNAENRDDELWDSMEVDTELVLGDYDAEEIRGIDWSLGLAGISAASQSQFFLDNREETIIKPTAYREQALAGFALTRTQMVTAGRRGFEIAGTAKFAKLQAQYLEKYAFLREMSNVELYSQLLDYGAILPAEQTIASAQGYVARMTNYPPKSVQFKEEVAKLIDVNSKRGLQGMNRRAVAQISMVSEIGGDPKKLLVWIGEGGNNVCSNCASRFGEVKTYEQWENEGLPGASVCLGGDLCRCQLVAV